MTPPNVPDAPDAPHAPDPTQKEVKPQRFRWVLKILLSIVVLIVAVCIWAITTAVGLQTVLNLVSPYTGLYVQGVSGNLVHQLSIERLELHQTDLEVQADNVEFQWQAAALLERKIQFDYLRINQLHIAAASTTDETPMTLPSSLALPQPFELLVAEQLAVNQLEISSLDVPLTALRARVVVDATRYQIQFSGNTEWGSTEFNGGFETSAPFKTEAQFQWQGLIHEQDSVTVPAMKVAGSLSGNWQKLLLDARLNVASDGTSSLQQRITPKQSAHGRVQAVLTPFASVPIEALQIDVNSVNPVHFYADAPRANLQIKADLKASGDLAFPTLSGQVAIKNIQPLMWDVGGLPFVQLNSELTLNGSQFSWKKTQVELEEGGRVATSGYINWKHSDAEHLPKIVAFAELKKLNLLRIDSRLKPTQLDGAVQIDSVDTGLQFGLDLQQASLDTQLKVDGHFSHAYVLDLKKIALRAKQATLSAQGSFALRDQQLFSVKGEAQHFNPANWINVPDGNIATRFDIAGQLEHGWRVDAKVTELVGQFAGLPVQGGSDVLAQQGKLLSIKKLEFNWGKNHLSAQGSWRLGETAKAQQESLQLKLAIPDLAELSEPFKKVMTNTLRGSLFIDGSLTGSTKQPSGQFRIAADQLAMNKVLELKKLQATLDLAEGREGKVNGNIDITGLMMGKDGFRVHQVQADLSGQRHAHQLRVQANLPRKQQFELQASGDLTSSKDNDTQWRGVVEKFNLTGLSDLQLLSPFALRISGQAVQMDPARWQGNLGKLQVQQLNWSAGGGQWQSKGQLQDLAIVNALKLGRSNLPLSGDLRLDGNWELAIGQQIAGQLLIQRTGGDITVQDVSGGYSQSFPLGLQNLLVKANVGQSNTRLAQSAIDVQLAAQGLQLGQIEARLRIAGSAIHQTEQGWGVTDSAPLSGMANLTINDIQWLSQLLGPGVALRGAFQAQAQLTGSVNKPLYSVKMNGKDLQVSFSELGMLLPNGVLEASLEKNISSNYFKLDKLRFSQTIKAPPTHDRLSNLSWINETGFVEASGTIDLQNGQGSIKSTWQRFPFLQTNEAWLVASGEAQLTESQKAWNLIGRLTADAAYFSTPKRAPPKLSSDVVVLKKNEKRDEEAQETAWQSSLDFTINTGKHFVFVGRGLDTRLFGELRIRQQNNGPLLGTGSIKTEGGTYEGYGQQLAIERGILNFQGPLDNPNLNVRALRRGLPVEAGVEIVGTVAKPEVRLISEPNVPDQDKLSWMILGRGSDQVGGSDASLLITAANAIFGGEGGSNIPRKLAETFGLDDISVGSSSSFAESQLPSQTVAGNIGNSTTTDQVFSVGKRITPDLVLSVERSLNDATSGIKLTWKLTRRFSIVGRTGSDTSVDAQYLFSFN